MFVWINSLKTHLRSKKHDLPILSGTRPYDHLKIEKNLIKEYFKEDKYRTLVARSSVTNVIKGHHNFQKVKRQLQKQEKEKLSPEAAGIRVRDSAKEVAQRRKERQN